MIERIAMTQTEERPARGAANGLLVLLLGVLALGPALWLFIVGVDTDAPLLIVAGVVVFTAALLALCGLYTVQPNQAVAITLFGDYRGSDRKTGLRWVLPWYTRKTVSVRARNVTSDRLKVNDRGGNPVEIAANVVWRVEDSAKALFDVDNYETFVNIQIDTGLRDIASHYAYDHGEEHEPTLRADAELVADKLRAELGTRVAVAGIVVDEARLAHLAYAPEIAGAMLRRQQAEAIIAARQTIVTGAVSMVDNALKLLSERGVVDLDEERKAAMVSNLLVVLCADREAQPVVNAGTLYG